MTDDFKPCDAESRAAGTPVPVETGRGLSVLYHNRYLYSRVDPSKNPAEVAHHTTIRPETLVLCVSPVLGYGLDIILEMLPPSSFVLALEYDENLMALSAAHLPQSVVANPSFTLIRTASISRLLETVEKLPGGPFRRCLRIDLSAGASLYRDFYAQALSSLDAYISRWWRNHFTVMKLGRNYARNLFRNCSLLPSSFQIPLAAVHRPILVAGAGPSLDGTLGFIAEHREDLYLLAVDTALPALRDSGITPDAVVLVESQFWIERAFTGFRNSRIPVFADMTARTAAVMATGGPLHFFFTEYMRASYLRRFTESGLSPFAIPPLGSVGLSAIHLALAIRAEGFPLFFTGLDFSWGKAFTHSNGAPAVRDSFARSGRLTPAGMPSPSFSDGVFTAAGKGGHTVYSDPSLSGYALLCADQFVSAEGVYDLGMTGLFNGCGELGMQEAASRIASSKTMGTKKLVEETKTGIQKEKTDAYLAEERERIFQIKNILTGTVSEESSGKKLQTLLEEADCLFLHFPDGYKGVSLDTAFLKRVRIELEYFLKTLDHPVER